MINISARPFGGSDFKVAVLDAENIANPVFFLNITRL